VSETAQGENEKWTSASLCPSPPSPRTRRGWSVSTLPTGKARYQKQRSFGEVTVYAVLVGGSNGDGAWRGMVTIFELIDPRPYKNQSSVYGRLRLIYTVTYMSDRLLT